MPIHSIIIFTFSIMITMQFSIVFVDHFQFPSLLTCIILKFHQFRVLFFSYMIRSIAYSSEPASWTSGLWDPQNVILTC